MSLKRFLQMKSGEPLVFADCGFKHKHRYHDRNIKLSSGEMGIICNGLIIAWFSILKGTNHG